MLRHCIRQLSGSIQTHSPLLWCARCLSDGKNKPRDYIPPASHYRNPLKVLKEQLFNEEMTEYPRETNVLIIGGGIVGNSVAYWVAQNVDMPAFGVTVVERDSTLSRSSSMLSVGGLRHQFSLPQNVEMSMFTTEFLRDVKRHLCVMDSDPPQVPFHQQGYLFLAEEQNAAYLETMVKMQRELGAKTVLLTKDKLAEKFPWLNLDGVEAGSYGMEGEGWFDPYQLVQALKCKNKSDGVQYVDGEVTEFKFESEFRIAGDCMIEEEKIASVEIRHNNGRLFGCAPSIVVNCAGPWAGTVAYMAGVGAGRRLADSVCNIPLPVEPRKRFVYVVQCPSGPLLDAPFLVDTSGVYFRREGLAGHYLCGASPVKEEDEPDHNNLDVDYDFYENFVWPKLANRVPQFEKSRLKSAWAGYYDYNTVDQNLIIGYHPYYQNLLFCNGMSGHGVQQGLAVGRAISELIFERAFLTIDLSDFSFDRIVDNKTQQEMAIV